MSARAAEDAWRAERFEEHRGPPRAVAYRMLGSLPAADDAVQESWVHVSTGRADGVENLGGWLTTIVARVCLNMLRARAARPKEPVGVHVPDPVVSREDGPGPAGQRAAGAAIIVRGRLGVLMGFTVTGGRISAIDGITDPERLRRLSVPATAADGPR